MRPWRYQSLPPKCANLKLSQWSIRIYVTIAIKTNVNFFTNFITKKATKVTLL